MSLAAIFCTPPSTPEKPSSSPFSGRPTDNFDRLGRKAINCARKLELGYSTNSTLSPSNSVNTTPEKKGVRFNLIPPTPMKTKNYRLHSMEPPFQSEVQLLKEDNLFLKELDIPIADLSFTNRYKGNGRGDYSLLTQCTKKGCGPATLLMLWSDQVKNTQNPPLPNNRFWEWVATNSGTSYTEMIHQAEKLLGISLKEKKLPLNTEANNNYSTLQSLIELTGRSVIASISHPQLGGHWILVDEVDMNTGNLFIRDPFSGKAYRVPFYEADQWFEDGTGLCLYVSKSCTS